MDRDLPTHIPGYGRVTPFTGACANLGGEVRKAAVRMITALPGREKLMPSLRAAIEASGLRDGGTVSFHHHLRNGDHVLNMVVQELADMGFSGLRVAPSSIFPVHAPLVEHMESGVVNRVCATYMVGPVAQAISRGVLPEPAIMYTHGGRARAIEAGDLHIDVAFVAAPTADAQGNIDGAHGKSACGSMGYAQVDARHADRVIAITDTLVPYPACPVAISQDFVDFVVAVESIGDPKGIVSGITRATDEPVGLQIAQSAASAIAASGLLVDGFSFQTGAGGISLAVAADLARLMRERGVRGSFASGGITGYIVDMLEAGLFRALFDVQCFDLRAVESFRNNPAHMGMSASLYANPHNRGAVVNQLDAMILGATEVDLDFNVNVTTGANGVIMGGSGGHADTAAGAKLAVVTTRLNAGGHAKIVDRVTTLTTPGETVDLVVTEAGVAVNPRRPELSERLREEGVKVAGIEELRALSARGATAATAKPSGERIVAALEYRDGTIIDVVRASAG
jgi:citrate lyase subunit alpha/citrate CoA-transferase